MVQPFVPRGSWNPAASPGGAGTQIRQGPDRRSRPNPTGQVRYSSEAKRRKSAARTRTFLDGRRRPLSRTSIPPSPPHMTMAPYDVLRRALSAERLSTYERIASTCGPDVTAESLYLWNMRLCGALMMPVHLCEVVTRNAAAMVLVRQHGPRCPGMMPSDAGCQLRPVLLHARHWNNLPVA
ncbi:hypothetical protein SMG44B_60189 [Stenotrophomonas maltophilia]